MRCSFRLQGQGLDSSILRRFRKGGKVAGPCGTRGCDASGELLGSQVFWEAAGDREVLLREEFVELCQKVAGQFGFGVCDHLARMGAGELHTLQYGRNTASITPSA